MLRLDRGARAYGITLLLALAGKLAWEQAGGGALTTLALGDAQVVTDAHLYGAIGGVAAALLLHLATRRG